MEKFEPKQFGKYFLLQKLAMGGMAEIYKAKTYGVDGFEKLLVIKRILPHCSADKDFISMLIDEAKLSVLLSHANIVQVYDLGKVAEDYYISMEFIHGVNLRDIMYRCREDRLPIPTDIAVYIASEICKGLDYAHRKTDHNNRPLNIIHRDVSPQNILLSYDGEVKIVDFGIAKAAMNISHTMAGILKGKIAYMSPEQAMGKKIDSRTDMFSAGILLYEMLTGGKLFTGESQFEILKKIRTTMITPETLPASIPAPLKPVVAKALAHQADNRFQHAGDLQIELTKYLYSTYIDFSPRKLAAFIKKIFIKEITDEQTQAAREGSIEDITTSVIREEGAKQMDIVHRDDTIPPKHAATGEGETSATATPIAPKVDTSTKISEKKQAPKKRGRAVLRMAMLLFMLAGAAYAAVNFVPALRFWEQEKAEPPEPVEQPLPRFGSVSVISVPDGANVFLDGKDTGRTTPTLLEELSIGNDYTIRAEKEKYGPAERVIRIASPERVDVSLELAEPTGTLNIITEPSGAVISVDGVSTRYTTPAVLEKLPVGKDLRITLSKPGFQDFEETINLTSTKPQRISTRLGPVAPRMGTLFINSTPVGAAINLDGKDLDKITPAAIADLEPKAYQVILKQSGFKDWSGEYEVIANQTTKAEAILSKIEEPRAEPPPTTAETPSKEVKKEPAKPEEKKPEKPKIEPTPVPTREPASVPPPAPPPKEPTISTGSGSISISSDPPGADVFINAVHKGVTPLTTSSPAGVVHILVSKEGSKYSKQVTVRPGETLYLGSVKLGQSGGEVSVTSTPSGAQVTLDGQTMPARTPMIVKKVRTDATHTITIQLPGYLPWSRTFSMEGERRISIGATLEPQ